MLNDYLGENKTNFLSQKSFQIMAIDIPRPLINDLWIILFQKGLYVMRKMSQSGWSIYVCQIIIVNVNKRLKPLYIDPYCEYCTYS